MRRALLCSAVLAFVCATHAQAGAPGRYASLVKEYFDGEWRASPSTATSTGLHDWDSQLDDVSAAAQARETARLSSLLTRLRGLDVVKLSAGDRMTATFWWPRSTGNCWGCRQYRAGGIIRPLMSI